MTVCDNCLGTDSVTSVPIGRDQGNQFDSYRITTHLCRFCQNAMLAKNWVEFSKRTSESATVIRPDEAANQKKGTLSA